MTNALLWPIPASELNDFISKLELPMFTRGNPKHPELVHTLILWAEVPWRNKRIKISSPQTVIVPPANMADAGQYLEDQAKKHGALLDIIEKEAKEVYEKAEFVDEDHKREFISKTHDLLIHAAAPGSIQKVYDKVTLSRTAQSALTELSRQLCVDDYPRLYPLAAGLERKATVILGPTNSGKTYRALQYLKEAKTGAYWGPLRLLALEVHERLCSEGKPCSLLTGEERIDVPGAGIVASTIEMMQSDIEMECVVIDEVQMLADRDRGWAWTQAIVGCASKHLVLVGSPDIWRVLEPLLERLNIEVELIKTERLQALTVEKEVCTIQDAKAGDAFIVFSRKDIFFYQELLAKRGLSTSIIYGSLGPEVRRAEAERFRSGEAKVLIATDAVGMGLNLPIARIVFTTSEKFDGVDVVSIAPALVKQIAGRAGRFGQFEEGYVSAVDVESLHYVRQCLQRNTKEQPQKLSVAPTVEQVQLLAKELQLARTSKALIAWRTKLLTHDPHFYAAPLYERVEMAIELEEQFPVLTLAEVARLSMVPLPRIFEVKLAFMEWMSQYSAAKIKHEAPVIEWSTVSSDIAYLPLEAAEHSYHIASMYCWLGRAFPLVFVDHEEAQQYRRDVAQHLIGLLRLRAKQLIGGGSKRPTPKPRKQVH